MLITALFVIAKNWKQPKYPLIGKWINKIDICASIKWNMTQQ